MKRILFIMIMAGALFSCGNNASNEIENVFYDINSANIAKDGNKMLDLSDKQSHQYYTDLLQKTINYDSMEITKLSIVDKINILSARAVLGESLLDMTGEEFMMKIYTEVNTIDENKKKAFRDMKLINVKINGNSATGELAPGGRSLNPKVYLRFNKENEKWKYNIVSMAEFTESNISMMLKENGLTDSDFINLVFTDPATQGKLIKTLQEAWNPIKK